MHFSICTYCVIVKKKFLICLYSFRKKKEEEKSVHLICMKASHWPLEKEDKVDISLRVMISVCICLHICVCLRHISELYDKTHQHITTRWNGGRRGRTDGGRDWKKWMTQGGVSISLSLTQCGSSGKGRAAQCKHVCVNSSMGRGQLFEMTVMAANAQSVYLPIDLFIYTHTQWPQWVSHKAQMCY